MQIEELKLARKQGIVTRTLMADYKLSKASVYRNLQEDVKNKAETYLLAALGEKPLTALYK